MHYFKCSNFWMMRISASTTQNSNYNQSINRTIISRQMKLSLSWVLHWSMGCMGLFRFVLMALFSVSISNLTYSLTQPAVPSWRDSLWQEKRKIQRAFRINVVPYFLRSSLTLQGLSRSSLPKPRSLSSNCANGQFKHHSPHPAKTPLKWNQLPHHETCSHLTI